jgi:hypothetical protein
LIMQQANGGVAPDPFADLEIPPELEQSLQRHREHLVQLVVTMRSAGIDEAHIDESVSVIVASYKEELLRAVKRMMNDRG